MLKHVRFFLTLFAILIPSLGTALAQETTEPIDTYFASIPVVSNEPVELHIGVIQENLVTNYPLEIAFLKKYPQGKIVYHYLNSEQLAAYFLGNSSTLDLVILTYRTTSDYAKQGVFTNLYDTSLLSAWPETWIDVKTQTETDGKLFRFPKAIQQNIYAWADDLALQVGVEKPERVWTWETFHEMCQSLPYDMNGDGMNEFFLYLGGSHISGLSGWVNEFLAQYAYQYARPSLIMCKPPRWCRIEATQWR